jgi:hypothetical protein
MNENVCGCWLYVVINVSGLSVQSDSHIHTDITGSAAGHYAFILIS